MRDGRVKRTTAALLAGTVAWNVLQNAALPRWTYTWLNAAGAVGALALGRRLGLSGDELGTSRKALRRGVAVGVAVAALVAAATAAALWASPTRALFRDARAEGLGVPDVLYESLVRIPVGTAFFEEALFRGLLLGWFSRHHGRGRGLLWSSVLFGLWHVLPTWEATALFQEGALRDAGTWQAAGAVAGGVALTSVAGAAFGVLRLRSGSLAAPVIVHAVANSSGFVAAWLLQR
jgi:membrane protease YdiL (CAAX protease family)